MLRNFFIVAFRNLRKNGLYSFINITGLSIGIVCSMLILLWVADEMTYDKFLPKSDRLFQTWVSAEFDGEVNAWRSVPLPTYEALKSIDSNIKNTVVAGWGGDRLLAVDETRVLKPGYYVSEEFLELFEYELIVGDPSTVLDDPMSIVITESLADVLFPDQDPLGQIVRVNDEGNLQVTGILKDIPGNSSFEFEYLLTWKYRESVNEWVVDNKDNWGNYSFQVFVELNDPTNELAVEAALSPLMAEHGEEEMNQTLFLYPMERWRLYSNFDAQGNEDGGRIEYVQLFAVIAIAILIIACINFMNLSTARSEKRAREVGIRKSLGSKRTDLIAQFIGESMFITVIAYMIAIIMTEATLPFYNDLVDKKLAIDYASPFFWLVSLGGILLVGVISGSYPAFYLSSFDPVKTLKGTIKVGRGATTPRKVLVIMQFSFSIFLMASTLVIFQQIDLVKNRDLGYDQENLISVELTNDLTENYDVLKQELLQSGAVASVTRSNSQITSINSNNFLGWPGKPDDQRVLFVTITAEYDYAKTMGIDVLMGRDFSKDFASDTAGIVINKAALDIMGLEDPIGTNLDLWGDKRKLVGVIDNALIGSVHEPIRPLFVILDDWGGYISVRLKKTNDLQETLANVEQIFNKHNPAYPFEYSFMDVEFQRKFTTITLTRKLATLFAGLAVFITGLGLFGLAAFTAEQRVKEIGIRKVLGASVLSLISLMSRDFTRLVIVAFLIAAPAAWYLLDAYLERYTIRIAIHWWIFPIIGIIALIFALLIVSDQARRAAQANPVNSLRNE